MPTAAKLVAGVLLAALAWFVSDMIRDLMPDTTAFGWFNYVNAALALIIGWRAIGQKAGAGLFLAISNGVTAIVMLVCIGLFSHAFYEMIQLSIRKRYSGLLDGIEDIFRIGAEYGAVLLDPGVIVTLLVGGVVVAVIAELVNSFWR
ncbi:MAG: TrgA family protein [Thalassovita sp.]|nr:TrgA family protein [Thalassovita sp.]